MSRCFPFPPPGYEKKIPITHSDPLKKEKHREKKHKKEKKDKVKKEDKEKNEKDKNDGKSRDKKDKREKHRDKKKEKRRDKDRHTDNFSTSDETRLNQLEGHDGQTVIHDSATRTLLDRSMVSGKSVGDSEGNHAHYLSPDQEPNGVKFDSDADWSTAFNAKRVGGQMREKISTMDHARNEGGGTFDQNSHMGKDFIESNLALELDRRLKNEAERPYGQNQTVNEFVGVNQKKDGRVIRSVSMNNTLERGNKITISGGSYVGDKSPVVKTVPYVSGPAQCNIARVARPPLVANTEKKIEGQEKINHQEDGFKPRGKKRKDKERNGQRKDNGKDKSKDKEKKEDKGNIRSDQKSTEQGTRNNQKMDTLFDPNKKMLHSGVYDKSYISNDGNLHQGEELLSNGISHVAGPGELSRPLPSLHLHNENGRMPEPRQIPFKPSPDGQGATNIFKVDKVGKVNGIIESETLVQRPATEKVVQARPRSPHPDTKRLLEIISVPKIEDLSEIDDSDWLISSKEGPEKKHRVEASLTSTVADTPHVWSKATTIKSADVYALPYVIPY